MAANLVVQPHAVDLVEAAVGVGKRVGVEELVLVDAGHAPAPPPSGRHLSAVWNGSCICSVLSSTQAGGSDWVKCNLFAADSDKIRSPDGGSEENRNV